MLSQYVEAHHALKLMNDFGSGVGYLLKDRVSDLSAFAMGVGATAVARLLGAALLLLATAAHGAALATQLAVGLALVLVVPAVVRDLRPVDLQGPAPVLSRR